MPEMPAFGSLGRDSVLEAAGYGALVLTQGRHLARSLKREHDLRQRAAGRDVWASPDILPWGAWLARCMDEARRGAGDPPPLLSPAQEQTLWERVVDESSGASLLSPAAAAAAAREAWMLVHEWELDDELRRQPRNEDGAAFLEWAGRYRGRCDRLGTDAARLPALVAGLIAAGRLPVPGQVVLCGFDRVTPAQRRLLVALQARGAKVALPAPPLPRQADAVRLEFVDAREEMRAAARWARARLAANPAARIGVVVPDLAACRSLLVRVFTDVLDPAARLPGRDGAVLPFNVSLGLPLAEWPLAHAALAWLQFVHGPMELNALGALLRSPFLGGADAERAVRARLDAELRSIGEPEADAGDVLRLARATGAAPAPVLARALQSVVDGRGALRRRLPPSAWSRAFYELLGSAGFPGERPLSSAEHQCLGRWRDALAALGALDALTETMDFGAALARLRRLAADAVFQPESEEVPVQVLGVLETAGQAFDHLWVSGLSDEAWPPAPRPSPFLPVALQRRHGLPGACAEDQLQFARRVTAAWLAAAPEAVLSSPRRADDRELGVSPLIAGIAVQDLSRLGVAEASAPGAPGSAPLAPFEDWRAPPLAPGMQLRRGVQVFADQAACPFRALARHRLDARALDAPGPGLSAPERGNLVHGMLAEAWKTWGGSEALAADETARRQVLDMAAGRALEKLRRKRPRTLTGRFLQLERERLVRLGMAWLEIEATRPSFTVEAVEERREIAVGRLAFTGRPDRVDRIEGGRRLVIDYKTGTTSASSWIGSRPDEPQLPLYAVAAGLEADGVAFAQVRAGEMRFNALARDESMLPGVQAFAQTKQAEPYGGWPGLLEAWRAELARLAEQFVSGHAPVDPKGRTTCDFCDVAPLCRIAELRGEAGDDEAQAAEDAGERRDD